MKIIAQLTRVMAQLIVGDVILVRGVHTPMGGSRNIPAFNTYQLILLSDPVSENASLPGMFIFSVHPPHWSEEQNAP